MADFLLPLLYVIGGMLVIFKSAEESTENATVLARELGISELAIGFILLSTATSLPEFAISTTAALNKSSDLSVGNVFGANIANVLFVIGVAAILGVVAVKRKDLKELVMILLGVSIISLFFVIYRPNQISGVFLFLTFIAYCYWLLANEKGKAEKMRHKKNGILVPFAKFSFFIAIVVIAAQFVVKNAIDLAALLGIGATVIGGTLIALGTTLPELSVSVAAAMKRKEKMAMGNAVGSAIVNLTLIFGVALMINPQINFAPALQLIIFSVIANMLLLYFIIIKGGLNKRDGILLVLAYLAFLVIYGTGQLS
jgi:cation:H+ antiporter